MAKKLTREKRKELLTLILNEYSRKYRDNEGNIQIFNQYCTAKEFKSLYPKEKKLPTITAEEARVLNSTIVNYQSQYPGKFYREILEQIKYDYKVHGNLPESFNKAMYKVILYMIKKSRP